MRADAPSRRRRMRATTFPSPSETPCCPGLSLKRGLATRGRPAQRATTGNFLPLARRPPVQPQNGNPPVGVSAERGAARLQWQLARVTAPHEPLETAASEAHPVGRRISRHDTRAHCGIRRAVGLSGCRHFGHRDGVWTAGACLAAGELSLDIRLSRSCPLSWKNTRSWPNKELEPRRTHGLSPLTHQVLRASGRSASMHPRKSGTARHDMEYPSPCPILRF